MQVEGMELKQARAFATKLQFQRIGEKPGRVTLFCQVFKAEWPLPYTSISELQLGSYSRKKILRDQERSRTSWKGLFFWKWGVLGLSAEKGLKRTWVLSQLKKEELKATLTYGMLQLDRWLLQNTNL